MSSGNIGLFALGEDLLRSGKTIRVKVSGGSMYPFIRGQEVVEIEPVDISKIRYADIIFYRDPCGKRIIHRVIGRHGSGIGAYFITKGDASRQSDGHVSFDSVLGRVSAVEKEYGTLRLDGGFSRVANVLYARCLPISKLLPVFALGLSMIKAGPKNASSEVRDVYDQQESEYYRNAACGVAILEAAKNLLGVLNERGVRAISLKGIFLAEHIYKNPALRPMSDIDILIRKKDLPTVNRLLAGIGYATPGQYEDLLKNTATLPVNSIMYLPEDPRRISIHVHWHLINSTWPVERMVAGMDMESIWSRARGFDLGGIKSLTLGPEDLILYLAHHGMHHSFDKPSMIIDIVESIEHYGNSLDWAAMLEESDRFGMSHMLYCALAFVSSSSAPRLRFPESLRPMKMSILQKIVCSYTRRGKCGYFTSYLACLGTEKNFSGILNFIFRTIFPTRPVMSHIFRISCDDVTALHYIKRLFGRIF